MLDPAGEPFGITPLHVFITLVVGGLTVLGFLWRMTSSLVDMQFKISLMWKDYKKRFKMENNEE